MRALRLIVYLSVLFAVSGSHQNSARGQTTGDANSNGSYTLHASTRAVLTDVAVIDRDGQPVHGIPRSAFHIFDNSESMQLASFEEHTGTLTVEPVRPADPDVFSNDFLRSPPPVLNILLIDITNLRFSDQAYLLDELKHFVDRLPAGEAISVMTRGGPVCVMLQSFTADHMLLLRAIRRAIPQLPPFGREYLSDIETMHQTALFLKDLPGRKNVLWFSGGSTSFLSAGDLMNTPDPNWRLVYDELESNRIAIYPIDARGLQVHDNMSVDFAQHMSMQDAAEATGGHAYWNTNGLADTAQKVIGSDGDFYMLSYTPRTMNFDNKWHKVRVALDGSHYNLSYRRGYFADGNMAAEQAAASRTRLASGGRKQTLPPSYIAPIIFEARVLPNGRMPERRGRTQFTVRYTLPADAFALNNAGGRDVQFVGVALVAVNRTSTVIEKDTRKFSVEAGSAPIVFDEQVELPRGDAFVTLLVWDRVSGRSGTVQFPLEVAAAGRTGRR